MRELLLTILCAFNLGNGPFFILLNAKNKMKWGLQLCVVLLMVKWHYNMVKVCKRIHESFTVLWRRFVWSIMEQTIKKINSFLATIFRQVKPAFFRDNEKYFILSILTELTRINLNSMLEVYIVLGAGMLVAFFTMIGEILWNRRKKRKLETVSQTNREPR